MKTSTIIILSALGGLVIGYLIRNWMLQGTSGGSATGSNTSPLTNYTDEGP